MWWSCFALGLEPRCLVIRAIQCGAFELWLDLFWLHVTFPKLHLWTTHFFCNAKDYQMVKTILSSIKTVPLVQSGFENKKGPHFYCCQNWSNQFCKIQNIARCGILELLEFLLLQFIPKNPKCTYSIEKKDCLHYGHFSLHPKIVKPILGVQASF